MKKEITTLDDIKLLVNSFYTKVQEDEMLSGIFNNAIQNRWPHHLEKMYRFWQTVLLNEYAYKGTPFAPHAKLPIKIEHFARWVSLFNQTVNEHFVGPKAEEAKWRAQKMADMFENRLFKGNPQNTIQ